jgi:hypothetical protein
MEPHGETRREGIRNKKYERGVVKINTFEDKLVNNRIRCCEHVLRMNEDRIPKILNLKLKGNAPEEVRDQCEKKR